MTTVIPGAAGPAMLSHRLTEHGGYTIAIPVSDLAKLVQTLGEKALNVRHVLLERTDHGVNMLFPAQDVEAKFPALEVELDTTINVMVDSDYIQNGCRMFERVGHRRLTPSLKDTLTALRTEMREIEPIVTAGRT